MSANEIIENKGYDEALQTTIKELIRTGKTDSTSVAKSVNKSPATLSLYLKGAYNGKVAELEADLRNFLAYFEKQQNTVKKELKFFKTTIAKKIFKAAAMCQMLGKMGVCYGSPGIGKTTAINEYKKDTVNVILVDPFEQTSARSVLIQIAEQLKLNYRQNMTLEEFTANIVKKLGKNKYLIIIDEAENLKLDIFKILRKIHDKTKNNCGILFAGTHQLQELLLKTKKELPYISSRIGYVAKLEELNLNDVEELTLQYYPDSDKNRIKTFALYSRHNARHLQNILDLCFEATKTGGKLTNEIIEDARECLII